MKRSAHPAIPVVITMFADFECPHSARAFEVVRTLRHFIGDDLQVEFRHFPLRDIHSHAQRAAEAAEVARRSGRFWPMATLLFKNQSHLDDTSLANCAEITGIDREEFQMDLSAGAGRERVDEDVREGKQRGVEETPTIYINGELFKGRSKLAPLSRAIGEAIEAARRGGPLRKRAA